METKGKCGERDERKSLEPQTTQRTQNLAQAVGEGGKTSCFQISHCEKFEGRSSEVEDAQRWGRVELAPPTRKAKPAVEGSVCRRIMRNARNDKRTQWIATDLSIKSIKANKPNPTNQRKRGRIEARRASRIKAN